MLSNKVGCSTGRISSLPTDQQHACVAFTSCGNDARESALACRQHAAATVSSKMDVRLCVGLGVERTL